MVSVEYKIAYSQVLAILNCVSEEEYNKIPKSRIKLFEANQEKDYVFQYNPNKTLDEQGVSQTAKTIIAILFRDYWATEAQREKIIAKEQYDRKKLEEEKKESYSYDNLFKNHIQKQQA